MYHNTTTKREENKMKKESNEWERKKLSNKLKSEPSTDFATPIFQSICEVLISALKLPLFNV